VNRRWKRCRLNARINDVSRQIGDKDASVDLAALKSQLEQLKQQREAIKPRRVMISREMDQPRTVRLLPRGNWLDDSGPTLAPSVPAFLGQLETGERQPTRLDLADWLVSTDANGVGPLTARVQVNRFWYLLFGRGLAKDLDDFGGQGHPPTHPHLLDRLALEFIDRDWKVKEMLKLMVMSRAYRQSSQSSAELRKRDPENALFARQSRYRLPAEMVRDTALSISGLLDSTVGGATAKPYQPADYYQHLNFPQRRYQAHDDARQWRRGLYVHWQRMFLHPMLKAFDAPSREECVAQRSQSNTPTAALTLLNDPTFVEAARVFAVRILAEGGTTAADRLNFAFNIALTRTPDAQERKLLAQLLDESRAYYTANPDRAEAILSIGLAKRPTDVDKVDLATWTAVARAILNLNEVITRN